MNKILTDEEITKAWGYANFGNVPRRQIILETLEKIIQGYHSGHTAMSIVSELNLIKANTKEVVLSENGFAYLKAAWLEETEPPYVNRLSEIVGKWPGDESAEEIIEGIKGEPQTNKGVTEEMVEKIEKIIAPYVRSDYADLLAEEINKQCVEPLQEQIEDMVHDYDVIDIFLEERNKQISSLQSENERLKKQLEEKTLSNQKHPTK